MFENVLGQSAAESLALDIYAEKLAPSMLFHGAPATGKGTAALETARVLSCVAETRARGAANAAKDPASLFPAACTCSSCARHRLLLHSDLLMFGPRPFSAEIAASFAAFQRGSASGNAHGGAYTLFARSVRKLLARFSPVLWEDEPKLPKAAPLVAALEESLDELDSRFSGDADGAALMKSAEAVVKHALKLENEGVSDLIPVSFVRKAAYWARIAPAGKRKIVIIENADRMQDEARNSLLKILEEPPETVSIILCSAREEALLPTVLSRLRPYRFLHRDKAAEAEVIRRVFFDSQEKFEEKAGEGDARQDSNRITAYLESFLPVPPERMRALAAYYTRALALAAVNSLRKSGFREVPETVTLLGTRGAAVAEAAGFERPSPVISEAAARVLKETAGFENRQLFRAFLAGLLDIAVTGLAAAGGAQTAPFLEAWKQAASEAGGAVLVFNQSPALALDALGEGLRRALAGGAFRQT